jgi:hypothetical protein
VKYLPLFHHFKAIYQFPKHIFLVKIVANAPLTIVFEICYLQSSITHIPVYMCTSGIGTNQEVGRLFESCCKLRGGTNFLKYFEKQKKNKEVFSCIFPEI